MRSKCDPRPSYSPLLHTTIGVGARLPATLRVNSRSQFAGPAPRSRQPPGRSRDNPHTRSLSLSLSPHHSACPNRRNLAQRTACRARSSIRWAPASRCSTVHETGRSFGGRWRKATRIRAIPTPSIVCADMGSRWNEVATYTPMRARERDGYLSPCLLFFFFRYLSSRPAGASNRRAGSLYVLPLRFRSADGLSVKRSYAECFWTPMPESPSVLARWQKSGTTSL